jgi:hypothetical protein
VLAHDVVADAQSGPVEIAVVAKPCARLRKLGQKASLRSGGHAIGADQWSAIGAPVISGDRKHVRVLADVNLAIRDGPRGR